MTLPMLLREAHIIPTQGDQIFRVQKRVKEYRRRVQKKGVLFVLQNCTLCTLFCTLFCFSSQNRLKSL
jgi:hypothetical protein